MPLHDWTRVTAGTFHDFHTSWISELKRSLNDGILPTDFYALAEQVAGLIHPDVLALRTSESAGEASSASSESVAGATAVLDAPPKVSATSELSEDEAYALKRNTIVIRHATGDKIVAMIEILCPGNKSSARQIRRLNEHLAPALLNERHLLMIDVHPPGEHDPKGIHGAFWDYLTTNSYEPPPDKPMTLVAYEAGLLPRAYIEPIALGQSLPEMPLFLERGWYINVPLAPSYEEAFAAVPKRWRDVIVG